MELTCFDVTTKDKVAHVQLNRPDALNTMIPAFWTELPQLIGELSDSGEVRAIVISSTGKHFSAGMDLSVFTSSGLSMDGEPGRRNATMSLLVKRPQDSFTALERARVPVLVAIQGGCIGGAVDMVCAADMRYATADAYFVVQETNIGMTADVGTLQRLPADSRRDRPGVGLHGSPDAGRTGGAGRAGQRGLRRPRVDGGRRPGDRRRDRRAQPADAVGGPRRRWSTRVTTASTTRCTRSRPGKAGRSSPRT